MATTTDYQKALAANLAVLSGTDIDMPRASKATTTVGTKTRTASPTATKTAAPAGYDADLYALGYGAKAAPTTTGSAAAKAANRINKGVGRPGSTGGSGGTQKVTYVDSSGQKKTGTAPAAYTPKKDTFYDDMAAYYQQMYDEQVAANNAANAAAADQARQATQAQIDALAASYADTNRQLYRDYMQNERTLPQQMAAQGYSGGLSESAMLRLRNAYEENLNVNERARAGQENAANAALAQQLFEAQMAADQANQAANQQRLGYLAQLRSSRYDQEQQRLQQRAQALAAAGNFNGYRDLGYSQAETDYLTRLWLSEHPDQLSTWIKGNKADAARLGISLPSSGGSSGGGGAASQAVAAYMNGASQKEISDALKTSVKSGEISAAAAAYADRIVKNAAASAGSSSKARATPVTVGTAWDGYQIW